MDRLALYKRRQAFNRTMPRRSLRRKLRAGFRAVINMADAVLLGGVEAGFVIIEIQRALRVEAEKPLADGPIFWSHF